MHRHLFPLSFPKSILLLFLPTVAQSLSADETRKVHFVDSFEFGRSEKAYAYPFEVGIAEASAFKVEVDETTHTVTLGRSLPQIDVLVRYSGPGIVWQYYSELGDQFAIALDAPSGVASPGPQMRRADILAKKRSENAHHPFADGIDPLRHPEFRGVVFCGDEASTESVKSHYTELPVFMLERPSMTQDEKDGWERYMVSATKDQLRLLTFVSDAYGGRINLGEFMTLTRPGSYRIRVGYCLYPDTKWWKVLEPLNNRVVVWSNPVPIEVVE